MLSSFIWSCQEYIYIFCAFVLFPQKVCMCSTVFWSCCVMPSSCSGTAFASWSGTIAAWWGRSWQVNTTHDSLLCRWMDTLHWNRELAWPPDGLSQTHKHTVLNCRGEVWACVRAGLIILGYKELHTCTCKLLVCSPGFIRDQNGWVIKCLHLLCVGSPQVCEY